MTRNKISADRILEALPGRYYVINTGSKKVEQSNDPDSKKNTNKGYKYSSDSGPPFDDLASCICHQFEKGKSNCIIEKGEGAKKEYYNASFSSIDDNYLAVTLEDVTGEFRTKKDLKINYKRLERAEQLADFGSWEFNIGDEIIIASKGAVKIYGLPSTRIPVKEVQKYALKNFRDALDKELEGLLHHGKPYNIKYKIKRPTDGEIRYIHAYAEYRKDKGLILGVVHDITETDRMQEAIIERENNLKSLFMNMNSGLAFCKIITDGKGKPVDYLFLDINDKFEEILGCKRKDFLNKRIREALPGIEQSWMELYGKVATSRKPAYFSGYVPHFKKHLEISAFSPQKDYIAVTFRDISIRVGAENALKQSLADLKRAQKAAKIENCKYIIKSRKLQWHEQFSEIMERNPSLEVIDEYKKYFGKENFERLMATIAHSIENNSTSAAQYQICLPGSNKKKWIEVICQPPENNNGEEVMPGTIQDITEKKETEEELYRANKLLRTLIDNIPDAIYMKDTQSRRLLSNKGDALHCRVEDADKIIGKNNYDIYPKKYADDYTETDRKVLKKGEAIINKEEELPTEGKPRIILTSKFPLKNNENEIIGLVGIGRDITEIKENQSKLNLMQQTVDQTPVPIMISDTEGNIEYVNPGFNKVTGYSNDEVIGKKVNILSSGLLGEKFHKNLWETISSGKTWHGEFLNRKKDGSLYWENSIVAPIFDGNNKIEHYVAVKEDITEKKQIIEDLRVAKEKAEESNRLKSIFLANLSHEIRTPLNGILGFSSLICSGMTEPDQFESYVEIIDNSARRLTKTIDDIIEMSMIQSNQVEFKKAEINLDDILEELFAMCKDLYYKKMPDIELMLEPCRNGDNTIKSDKLKIKQMLSYILDNAFKFTDKGFIRFGYFTSDEKQLILFVEDTGIGIEKNKLDIIFEPFRQVEEEACRGYEGSGLGLAISVAIMEKMGGSIEVVSEIGKGTKFYLKFNK